MTTAAVIHLPTAAQAPVVQVRRRGRFPKSVASFRDADFQRMYKRFDDERLARTLAGLSDMRAKLLGDAESLRAMMVHLQDDAAIADRRPKVMQELRDNPFFVHIRGGEW